MTPVERKLNGSGAVEVAFPRCSAQLTCYRAAMEKHIEKNKREPGKNRQDCSNNLFDKSVLPDCISVRGLQLFFPHCDAKPLHGVQNTMGWQNLLEFSHFPPDVGIHLASSMAQQKIMIKDVVELFIPVFSCYSPFKSIIHGILDDGPIDTGNPRHLRWSEPHSGWSLFPG